MKRMGKIFFIITKMPRNAFQRDVFSKMLGDIGNHFPDTDEQYKNADSLVLLACVKEIINNAGYEVGNVDATIIAQAPKLAPFIPQMRLNIARALEVELDSVSIKAATEEHLGFTGEEKGIAAHAVCLVYKK